MREAQKCKILLLGESAVGKTSLFKQFTGQLKDKPTPTIGVQYKQKIIETENGKMMKVQIWDTAGTERFRTITPIYYRNVDGVLLVFDITDKASFRSIQYWVQELNQKQEHEAILILVGNKRDREGEREVSREEAERRANQLNITYVESSSLSLEQAKPPFDLLIAQIIEKRKSQKLIQTQQRLSMSKTIVLKQLPKHRQKSENDCC